MRFIASGEKRLCAVLMKVFSLWAALENKQMWSYASLNEIYDICLTNHSMSLFRTKVPFRTLGDENSLGINFLATLLYLLFSSYNW